MCGRYTIRIDGNYLINFSNEEGAELFGRRRFNVAPTQEAPIVRPVDDQPEITLAHWGLVPSWAKDPKIGARMINARSETVAEKPSFRAAFKRRRCLVLADGYYEWRKVGKEKWPFHIHLQDRGTIAFAGLWEVWKSEPDTRMESFTIITTTANEFTKELHDRMPVILSPDDYEQWLDPAEQPADRLTAMLEPYAAKPLQMTAVSQYVNSVRHEGPECIEPIDSSKPPPGELF